MALATSAILCLGTGFLLIAIAFRRSCDNLLLRICLSAGFGLAMFSFTYFLARVAGFMRLWMIDFGIFAILLATYLSARKHPQRQGHSSSRAEQIAPWGSMSPVFLLASCAAVYSAVMRTVGHPYGNGWDSLAIWNLHARFLYRGGSDWRDGFSTLIPWSHPDYPLLLPAAIAHFWTIAGKEAPAVPALIGLLFTCATVGLLFGALDTLVGRTSALLGGMALLCSPFFIELGTWQYADVPLSFFLLAALVLFHISEHHAIEQSRGVLALAGFAAGCAAWTKNEGILFLCSILCARISVGFLRQRRGLTSQPIQLLPTLCGLIPVLCVLFFFKHSIAPPGDLLSDRATMIHKLGDAWRYVVVLKWYGKEFLRFGHWLLIPVPLLMVAFYFMMRKSAAAAPTASVHASILALGLTLAGYFLIYVITPYDLYWHLRFSLARLFTQVWPSAVFLFFLRLGPLSPPLDELRGLQH